MLTTYQTQVGLLLHDPTFQNYSQTSITSYINSARNQIALDSESLRYTATYNAQPSNPVVGLNLITVPPAPAPAGLGIAMAVRQMKIGSSVVANRPWEWYWENYQGLTTQGQPTIWSQESMGANGIIYLYPVPDQVYALSLDCLFLPIVLTSDSDPEAISYPWTDAVQYYAAYLAFLNSQREGSAGQMWQLYLKFMRRATAMTTPSVLPMDFPGGDGARAAGMRMPIGAEAQ